MVGTIDANNDGFDGGVAFDKNASDCARHLGCAREVARYDEANNSRVKLWIRKLPRKPSGVEREPCMHDAQTHFDDWSP